MTGLTSDLLVAQLVACLQKMQADMRSTLRSGTFFCEHFIFLPLIQEQQLSVIGENMCNRCWLTVCKWLAQE